MRGNLGQRTEEKRGKNETGDREKERGEREERWKMRGWRIWRGWV